MIVHPLELENLDVLDGDPMIIGHARQYTSARISPSQLIGPGQVGIPPRIRNQIDVSIGKTVTIVRSTAKLAACGRTAALVIYEVRKGRAPAVWLAEDELRGLGLTGSVPVSIHGHAELPSVHGVSLYADPFAPRRAAALSSNLMHRLVMTLGEVITITGDS